MFSSSYSSVQDSALRSQISVFTMLQLQLQPLHSLSSHLVDLLGELVSLSFSSQILKPEEDPRRRPFESPDDAAAQIWRFYRSGKQTKSDPALRPSSRYKTTKNRPLPPPSTLTPASTQHLSLPLTMTPADPTNLERPSIEKFSTYGVNNNKPLFRRAVIAGKRLSRYKKLGQGSGLLMVGLQSPTRLIKPRQEEFQIVDALLNGFDDDSASEDLLFVASFKLFSFIPRSEISIVDDLAKKAVRSMTTGLSMFL